MITSFPSSGWRSERIARVRRRTVASARLRAGRAVSEAIPRRRARTRDRTRRSSPRTSGRIERALPLHSQARRGPSATAEAGTVAVASSLLTNEPLAASGPPWSEAALQRACLRGFSAQGPLACDEKVERAEQPQHKPAVAEKAQKQNKQQQKAKKADTSEKTTVARADK